MTRSVPRRGVLLAVGVGMVAGAACSDGMSALADAAADAATALIRAVDVRYDPTAAGLAVTDVQAALDALHGRLAAVEAGGGGGAPAASAVTYDPAASGLAATHVQGALDALAARPSGAADGVAYDGTASGLAAEDVQGAVDALAAAVGALAGRVTAVEGAAPTAAGVSYDATRGPAGATVQAALETLHAAVTALQTENAALKVRLDALEGCPEGTVASGRACIEAGERTASYWHFAVGNCIAVGRRLCTYDELYAACIAQHYTPSGQQEWTATFVGDELVYAPALAKFDCDATPVPVTDILGPGSGVLPFRCCQTR